MVYIAVRRVTYSMCNGVCCQWMFPLQPQQRAHTSRPVEVSCDVVVISQWLRLTAVLLHMSHIC